MDSNDTAAYARGGALALALLSAIACGANDESAPAAEPAKPPVGAPGSDPGVTAAPTGGEGESEPIADDRLVGSLTPPELRRLCKETEERINRVRPGIARIDCASSARVATEGDRAACVEDLAACLEELGDLPLEDLHCDGEPLLDFAGCEDVPVRDIRACQEGWLRAVERIERETQCTDAAEEITSLGPSVPVPEECTKIDPCAP